MGAVVLDDLDQSGGRDRFLQIDRDPEPPGFLLLARLPGDDDDRYVPEPGVFQLLTSEIHTVHERHLKVEQNQAGPNPGAQQVKGVLAVLATGA